MLNSIKCALVTRCCRVEISHVCQLGASSKFAGLCFCFVLLFQGNLFDFLRLTGWRGSKVLYFGDHLYSDLAVSCKACIDCFFFKILAVLKFIKHKRHLKFLVSDIESTFVTLSYHVEGL